MCPYVAHGLRGTAPGVSHSRVELPPERTEACGAEGLRGWSKVRCAHLLIVLGPYKQYRAFEYAYMASCKTRMSARR